MIILHTGDLHIGKAVHGFQMLEDQEHALERILGAIVRYNADVLLVAGDIYDKRVPSAEAVTLFDRFITRASELCGNIMIIPGNHDSAERLSFAGGIIRKSGVFIAEKPEKVTVSDSLGEADFYLVPYIRPSQVRHLLSEQEAEKGINTNEAVKRVLNALNIDGSRRSVLVSHQFYAAAGQQMIQSDSEAVFLGGTDVVDTGMLAEFRFDYAALGHLHGAQKAGSDNIRYSGSPLKYSFSEHNHRKSIVKIALSGKGSAETELVPITCLRDMRKIRGALDVLTSPEVTALANTDDYIHATLTDEDEPYDAIGKLRACYPNIMHMMYDNTLTRASEPGADEASEEIMPLELFKAFYSARNGADMSEWQERIMSSLFGDSLGDSQ